MKDYFIRLLFGLLTIAIVLGISYIFNIGWLHEGSSQRNLLLIPLAIGGGWGGWYLFKAIKYKKIKE